MYFLVSTQTPISREGHLTYPVHSLAILLATAAAVHQCILPAGWRDGVGLDEAAVMRWIDRGRGAYTFTPEPHGNPT